LKVFIDANLLIYLNTISDLGNRVSYENLYVDVITNHKPYVDVLVFDELLYVSWKKYGVPYSITIDFIEKIVKPYVYCL
jgi:predicted nucleic acid-binding protein